MGKYTDPNVPCKNCGQFVANHTWVEPQKPAKNANESDAAYATRINADADYQKQRNEAQYERGANHDPNIKCSGYEPAS